MPFIFRSRSSRSPALLVLSNLQNYSPFHLAARPARPQHTYRPFTVAAPATSDVMDEARAQLAAVERGFDVIERVIAHEQAAFKPDAHDRVPAEMPTALRAFYETGTWSNAPVYCWDLVSRVASEGHEKAREAEDALAHMSFRPPPGLAQVARTALRAEHSPAVIDAADYGDAVRDAVRDAIRGRRDERARRTHELAVEYQELRKSWRLSMAQALSNRSQKQREENLVEDRLLVMATRAVSGMGGGMSVKECDAVLDDVQSSGGTSGGVTRWGASLATIPDQNPAYSAPDGGILIDDPLAAHYTSKNVNPWTRAERLLFLEKFLAHSKNFRRISSFFEHKSVEDVVRFYFENKKPLKLKQLTKDSQVKKRGNKKNLLIELSRMPIEGRSIKNNFVGEAASAIMDRAAHNAVSVDYYGTASYTASESEASRMREAGKGWKPADQQALTFALCRHKIEDDFTSLAIPAVWCQIAHEVRTKSPGQCRQYYAHFKSLLSLEMYAPPDLTATKRSAPKRRRVGNGAASPSSGDGWASEPPTNRPRIEETKLENGNGLEPKQSMVAVPDASTLPATDSMGQASKEIGRSGRLLLPQVGKAVLSTGRPSTGLSGRSLSNAASSGQYKVGDVPGDVSAGLTFARADSAATDAEKPENFSTCRRVVGLSFPGRAQGSRLQSYEDDVKRGTLESGDVDIVGASSDRQSDVGDGKREPILALAVRVESNASIIAASSHTPEAEKKSVIAKEVATDEEKPKLSVAGVSILSGGASLEKVTSPASPTGRPKESSPASPAGRPKKSVNPKSVLEPVAKQEHVKKSGGGASQVAEANGGNFTIERTVSGVDAVKTGSTDGSRPARPASFVRTTIDPESEAVLGKDSGKSPNGDAAVLNTIAASSTPVAGSSTTGRA